MFTNSFCTYLTTGSLEIVFAFTLQQVHTEKSQLVNTGKNLWPLECCELDNEVIYVQCLTKCICGVHNFKNFPACSPVNPITNVLPLVLVLSVSLAKEGFEDRKRAAKDKEVAWTGIHLSRHHFLVSQSNVKQYILEAKTQLSPLFPNTMCWWKPGPFSNIVSTLSTHSISLDISIVRKILTAKVVL